MSIVTVREKAAQALNSDRHGPPASSETIVACAAFGLLAAAAAGGLLKKTRPAPAMRETAQQGLYTGAATLAASVLVDSALEHFRGNYFNRAMFIPPFAAAASLAASVNGNVPAKARNSVFGASGLIGLTGLGFHIYNMAKRPGGFSWNNLFYAAPIAAPGALGLAGAQLSGMKGRPAAARLRLSRAVAFLLSGGLLATVGEVALLHFRGAFHDPFMYAPLTAPPLAASALAAAAAKPTPARIRLARFLLKATGALGLAGMGFHAFGVSRNMGGWRNWTQNLFQGPPIPAPPSFTGIAAAGLSALRVLEEETRGNPSL